jgi:5-formaminoimidazole-4-carboxamide-1-beta-D-ribofuranosyl 5'-monophosphate synthetase
MILEKWSLERFCLGPELQNFYCQFFWGFPLSRFDFIGITEFYETEFDFFSRVFLGDSLQPAKENINPKKGKASYFDDEELINKIKKHHSKDVVLYEKALNIRLKERS